MRSSSGQVAEFCWKRNALQDKDLMVPMGTPVSEAFTMLQLKNNYFAWLLEAKESLEDKLITDYDSGSVGL